VTAQSGVTEKSAPDAVRGLSEAVDVVRKRAEILIKVLINGMRSSGMLRSGGNMPKRSGLLAVCRGRLRRSLPVVRHMATSCPPGCRRRLGGQLLAKPGAPTSLAYFPEGA